jgi:protein gp37
MATPSKTKTARKAPTAKPSNKNLGSTEKSPSKSKNLKEEGRVESLTKNEQTELAKLESTIKKASALAGKNEGELAAASRTIAEALYHIQSKNLYRASSKSFAEYSRTRFSYSLAHAKRLAAAGKIWVTGQDTNHPEIVALIKNEAMARPLAKLNNDELEQVYATLSQWMVWKGATVLSGKIISAAITYHATGTGPKPSKFSKTVETIHAEIESLKNFIDKEKKASASKSFGKIESALGDLVKVKRSTGISWTEHTWNPIVGCTYASEGCKNCYAAFQMGTLMASMHKDLVTTKTENEGGVLVERYTFNGKIKLLPEKLDEPLRNSTPSKYFVNSLSDLFHKNVPQDFIEAVFAVMEKAHWHTFQVLTKRPDVMAKFTKAYYKDKTPPPNIWLGTSTENQATFDKRLPHLLETKAAVRWLSMEPLIGNVVINSIEGLQWIVVGGESGSEARKMDAEWVRSIRDASKENGVPFFFKQWGKFGEEGQELKGKAAKAQPEIDGETHHNWPE